jgi:hypothetical protein
MWVCEGSWLDSLRIAAHRIAPGSNWTEEDAVRFILTGYGPVPAPLRVTSRVNLALGLDLQTAVIHVQAQPFVSPKAVAAGFAREQRKLLGHRKGPAVQESNLRLLDFVLSRIKGLGEPQQWETLRQAWNTEAPRDWQYADAAHIRNDFQRTRKIVLCPGYEHTLPGGLTYRVVEAKRKRGKVVRRRGRHSLSA